MSSESRKRYGQWGVVAGASEGLGAAFAWGLAARGHDVLLLARRKDAMVELAAEIEKKHGVQVRSLACDLADAGFAQALTDATRDLEIGVAVYNAGYSTIGPMLERPVDQLLRVVDVNCRGPVLFARTLAPGMTARGRGALVLMSSLAGISGSAGLAAYAASKAFNIALGHSLWAELRPKGVDVVVSCAGAIRTPNYQRTGMREAPGVMDPGAVAGQTLNALGGSPLYVPGFINKLAAFVFGHLLSRKQAVAMMSKASAGLS